MTKPVSDVIHIQIFLYQVEPEQQVANILCKAERVTTKLISEYPYYNK